MGDSFEMRWLDDWLVLWNQLWLLNKQLHATTSSFQLKNSLDCKLKATYGLWYYHIRVKHIQSKVIKLRCRPSRLRSSADLLGLQNVINWWFALTIDHCACQQLQLGLRLCSTVETGAQLHEFSICLPESHSLALSSLPSPWSGVTGVCYPENF